MGVEESAAVLVVDDDENQRWMVQNYLQKHGFVVHTAADGVAMREIFAEHSVSVVLLDVTMPGEDGFTLARYVRANHKAGIIMLTASTELVDRVLGLEIGADDYITKPFEPRELMARVKALQRRLSGDSEAAESGTSSDPDREIAFGDFLLNLDSRELRDKDGGLVTLTSMEFDLLQAFAENPGRVMTRDTLLNLAHKRDWDPYDRSVDIRVGRVRRKIEVDPSKPEIIKTVRGVGYMFVKA
jgi:two-component system phosphate regulon response regulator OmpR